MSETMVTVVGNVATAPVFREMPSGAVARFRLAATARRRDRETGRWTDGHTNFFTVWAWRALGENVAASLSVGEPVIVQGKLKVRQDDRGGGQQWMSADIDAFAVGHDLSRGTTAFRRTLRTDGVPTGTQPAQPAQPAQPDRSGQPGETGPDPVTDGQPPGQDGRPPVQWERPVAKERPAKEEWPAEAERAPGEWSGESAKEGKRPARRRTPEPATAT